MLANSWHFHSSGYAFEQNNNNKRCAKLYELRIEANWTITLVCWYYWMIINVFKKHPHFPCNLLLKFINRFSHGELHTYKHSEVTRWKSVIKCLRYWHEMGLVLNLLILHFISCKLCILHTKFRKWTSNDFTNFYVEEIKREIYFPNFR